MLSYEEYFPYGGTAFLAGDSVVDISFRTLRYVGKDQDDATGFYVFQFRYYAPFVGNWISPDPAGEVDGPNLYWYAHNNPVSVADMLGLVGDEEEPAPDAGVLLATPPEELEEVLGNREHERAARAYYQRTWASGQGIILGELQWRDGHWYTDPAVERASTLLMEPRRGSVAQSGVVPHADGGGAGGESSGRDPLLDDLVAGTGGDTDDPLAGLPHGPTGIEDAPELRGHDTGVEVPLPGDPPSPSSPRSGGAGLPDAIRTAAAASVVRSARGSGSTGGAAGAAQFSGSRGSGVTGLTPGADAARGRGSDSDIRTVIGREIAPWEYNDFEDSPERVRGDYVVARTRWDAAHPTVEQQEERAFRRSAAEAAVVAATLGQGHRIEALLRGDWQALQRDPLVRLAQAGEAGLTGQGPMPGLSGTFGMAASIGIEAGVQGGEMAIAMATTARAALSPRAGAERGAARAQVFVGALSMIAGAVAMAGAPRAGRPAEMIDVSTQGRTAAEIASMRNYARIVNDWIAAQGGRVRVRSTAGPLRRLADRFAARERRRAARAGTPYQGAAGHVPDTALSGLPNPPLGWLDMLGGSNSVMGGGLSSRIGRFVGGYLIDGKPP